MKLTAQVLSVVLMALFLQACQLGSDDANAEVEATDIIRSVSQAVEPINRADLYRFIVTGDSNKFELFDDLSAISISGDNNQITIMEDTALEELTITGNGNLLMLNTGLSTRIDNITILGDGHNVLITEYVTLNDDTATNSSVSGTQITP